ncbi:hypothetical protein AMATHDRAFT_1408 [Amanita thiersii Skay4041]|uniref:Peroxisomal membrane protein PEX17 n=1 Tax=Amanita thiersii Skay4041 TaxID=703135 RepID=A0A2A9NY31_9AGAR|nr:hypothetical protein AMATHDRAFT_1408 [Amanita thiersii Skay4041]
MDQSYRILLDQLYSEQSNLPLLTIQAALSHHLATLSPLPTPLAATIVSSPFYLSSPLTHEKLQSLSTAFRHAVHLKLQALEKKVENQSTAASLFSLSPSAATAQWITEIVKGLQGGRSIMRLACSSGLLLGIEDLEKSKRNANQLFNVEWSRSMVEDELVLNVAETIDVYGVDPPSDWEKEFQPTSSEYGLPLSLILASQCLPLASKTRLKALPLPVLTRILVSIVLQTIDSGSYMSDLSQVADFSTNTTLHIPHSFAHKLRNMASSPPYVYIASLSKLMALALELMLDSRPHLIPQAIDAAIEVLSSYRQVSKNLESNWNTCPLLGRRDEEIAPESKETAKLIWTSFKTILFSMIMVAQATLAAVIYVPPDKFSPSAHPEHLALEVLYALYHLSFLLSEFGGISATSQGFSELKKTVYLAFDILAQSPQTAEGFAKEILLPLGTPFDGTSTLHPVVQQTKTAFVLVCIEQLVPILSMEYIRDSAWEICYPYLSDTSHREIFESAHSVILSILAAHAQTGKPSVTSHEKIGKQSPMHPDPENFVTRIIPYYAQCLMENSGDGKLSTAQLKSAFSALVRTASNEGTADSVDSSALAWYCIEVLIGTINELSTLHGGMSEGQNKGLGKRILSDSRFNSSEEHLHRLHLTLIATVSALPISLMLGVLDQVREIIINVPKDCDSNTEANKSEIERQERRPGNKAMRDELITALFEELLERVGDREKEAAMRWWYANQGYFDSSSRFGAVDLQ